MLKQNKKEIFWLVFLALVFVILRSINFARYLTFFGWDQAEHAILALEAFRAKKLVLIGPKVSAINFQGRYIFLGPLMTYLMGFFLVLGSWEPQAASYFFMLMCGLMVFPLYFGVKWLINDRAAWIIAIVYTLLPYYLTYTRFMWNPNFQFALLPLLFFVMGLYAKLKKFWLILLVGFCLGLLFQLHYQFIFSAVFIAGYYFLFKKENRRQFLLFAVGFVAAVSPLILFELRHQFYLSQTLYLYWEHAKELEIVGNKNHYWLSQSFLLLLAVLAVVKNQLNKIEAKKMRFLYAGLFVVLLLMASRITFVRPERGFWAPVPNWFYATEVKIYKIVKGYTQENNLTDYNVTNQMYDPLAMLQKYMIKRDGVPIKSFDDYWHEKYLFVVDRYGKTNFMDNPGYEMLTLRPYKIQKTWRLNDSYVLHLVERLSE